MRNGITVDSGFLRLPLFSTEEAVSVLVLGRTQRDDEENTVDGGGLQIIINIVAVM